MSNIDLIKNSRDLLSGRWLNAVIVVVLVALITGIPQNPESNYSFSILSVFINGAISLGTAIFFLNIIRGKEARIENMFDGFRKYVPSLVAYILFTLIVVLGVILFIIPGVILALGLSQTFFILADDKNNISGVNALKKSWEIMDGYKMKYFLLNIIHFGMIILGLIAFIIGIFYVLPIIYSSLALFYDKLIKGELQSS